ncbi:MAG: DUF2971 domain-containing protein [Thermodesulfovibrionales bacterium]|jgi:hypothetical protein
MDLYFGESKKRWQKAFINDLFKHKTNIHDTFSKIALNNIGLIEGKTKHLPKSLFRFYTPTSDNIIDIKKQRLWMPHPGTFNDPFDCRTGYDVKSFEKHTLLKYIKESGYAEIENAQDGFTIDEFNRLLRSTTFYNYNWYGNVEEYDTVFRKLLEKKSEEFNRKIYSVIAKYRREVGTRIEKLRSINIRVASFSALDRRKGFDDIIQMWSHYADNHKGFCVEYDISPLKEPIQLSLRDYDFRERKTEYMAERMRAVILAGMFPVIYTASRVNIPKTKLNKITFDEINGLQHNSDIDSILYKTFIVKSAKWNYEKEWRIILDGDVCNYYDNRIPFPYIRTIFLGCKMNTENIDTMIEIAEELGAEVVMMSMDNEKFILKEHGIKWYKWDKETSKWGNPFYL